MTTHKLHLRRFLKEFDQRSSNREPSQFVDEVVTLPCEAGSFRISSTQVLFVPRFIASCPRPQWGFILDDSHEVQKKFPVLVIEIGHEGSFELALDQSHCETNLLSSICDKFPKTFRR